jgi:hypothetical protein
MNPNRPTLAILSAWTDDFWRRRYLVQLLIPRWEEMGFRVVTVTEQDPWVPADIALLHVDLSVVPEACRRLAARYPRVLNGGALDIRKRRFSTLQVAPQGPDPGRVIVKTDWNGGGGQEFRREIVQRPVGRLLRRLRVERFVLRQLSRLETRRSWSRRRMLDRRRYYVFRDRASVPAGVWRNPNLLVERFAAEQDGNRFCCRHWLFFGRREVTRRTLSASPVVKCDATMVATADPIPEELRRLRERLGFDYGKFDYAIIGEEVVLYDTNRTPGALADPSAHAHTVAALAEGMRDFAGECNL